MSALVDTEETSNWNDTAAESDASVVDEERSTGGDESESDEGDDGTDSLLLKKDTSLPKKETNMAPKQMSKAEKAALKKKELDEMDDIFSEMGLEVVSASAEEEVRESPVTTGDDDKKKKKKKKKTAVKTKNEMKTEVENLTLTEDQIKAKLADKLKAKKGNTALTAAQKAAQESEKKKKKVYGNYDL